MGAPREAMMPRRREHTVVGVAVGVIAAAIQAGHEPGASIMAELIGGAFGGWLGGIAPDVLEPAKSPNHRSTAHSGVALGALALARIAEWQAHCRESAAMHAARAVGLPVGCDERSRAELAALVWRLAAAALVGFAAGYASHLLLDAGTARGLPLAR